ncbi:hypothetical protein XENOCAPTIV_017330 [Xenoophorus captivus]|uniref:Uncharacterized protein n=1 Tax=Xenoophorus captivus TaxID=1517983 RepID=A0ABV0RQY9_9TELE
MGATVFVQPLDLVKNRMQLSGQGTKAREYKTSFHALLSAGLLRQATYTTTRLGIYTILFEKMTGADGRPPNFFLKVGPVLFRCSAVKARFWAITLTCVWAGSDLGSVCRLPADQRRGYTNVFNALARITREEGLTTLVFWRRHSVSLLRQYDQRPGYHGSIDARRHREDQVRPRVQNLLLHHITWIQNMRMIDGKPEYKNGLVSFRTRPGPQ